jgi:outer membrane protein OmpA-like peptidoglycan-associated protein
MLALVSRLAMRCAPVLLALSIAACSTTKPAPSPGVSALPPPAPAPVDVAPPKPAPAPPPASPLATEQRFLEDWFRGTPVLIAAQDNGTLQVDVPLANSFDAGKADIKPALGAVLERVAESLRRQAGARITIAAAADARGSGALANTRAQRVREHLLSRRIAAPRISLAEAPMRAGGPVQMRLAIPPPGFPGAAARAKPLNNTGSTSAAVPPQSVKPVSTAPMWTEKKP